MKTLLRHVLAVQGQIVTACCLDSGKTRIDAYLGEILVTVEKLQWTLKHGEAALSASRRPTNLLMAYKRNTVYYEALGVVAACVSWNYPFHNFIGPIISALFTGNAIILKPSEEVAWSSSTYFLPLVRGALLRCNEDPELVQSLTCLPDTADHLTSHPGISHITFIGSRPIAHKVAASAAKSLTPVCVELGGKDPAIILDDIASDKTRLSEVSAILLRGVFQASGQNCIGIERVIALPAAHDALLSLISPKIQALRLGSVLLDERTLTSVSSSHSGHGTPNPHLIDNTPDIGAMISPRTFTNLESLIQAAVAAGAVLHCGGRAYTHPQYPHGSYFAPTLLSGVTPDMRIAQTELFAPVFLLMRAESIDHAIDLANSTPYALGASVFGKSGMDLARCVSEAKAGMVSVNDFGSYYAVGLPFGGRDGSGYGRFGGEEGLRALCNVKAVCEDAWWARMLGMGTRIPGKLQYPINDGMLGKEVCEGVIGLGYGETMEAQATGLWRVVRVEVLGWR